MAIPGMFLVIQNVLFLAIKHSYDSRTQHVFLNFALIFFFFFFGQIDDVRKFLSPKFKCEKFYLQKSPKLRYLKCCVHDLLENWRG